MDASGYFFKRVSRACFGGGGAAVLSLLAASATALAVGPKSYNPAVRISLESLGFQPFSARIAALGGTLLTLNYVDDTHLLVTFYIRTLMPRLPDAKPEDEDGVVQAQLVELPTARVIAKTEWRLRDRDPYLWSIGYGHFLVRVRTRLSILNPLGNLKQGDPFREQLFDDFKRRIGYVAVTPSGDLLTVETLPPAKPRLTGGAASAAALAATQGKDMPEEAESGPQKPKVQVLFYRLIPDVKEGQMARQSAGGMGAPGLVNVPTNSDGYIGTTRESATVYDFDFITHSGEKTELAAFDTTCRPHPYFVSRSEFVALGCHGAPDKPELGGFNLKGEHAWIEVLSGDHLGPIIQGAPAAGRFAMSRITLNGISIDPQNVIPEQMMGQEVSVRQNHDGRLLLKLQASPIQRAGQNFDISPSGMELAIVRAGNIEIYRLPPLTAKDQKQMKLAAAMQPAKSEAPLLLGAKPEVKQEGIQQAPGSSKNDTDGQTKGVAGAEVVPGGTVAPATSATIAPAHAEPAGDAPEERRKPPTLYDSAHPKKPE